MEEHHVYMRRALELAQRGKGQVSPNPLVGCVIVKDGRISGEGWHERFGGPHAEINAIRTVSQPEMLAGATLYVNLEPCSHHGKTPPCAEAIVKHRFAQVVIGCADPNPLVNGRGIGILESAGIKVSKGILEQQSLELNKRFITGIAKNRPWILLKWAESADGFIARTDRQQQWISNLQSRQMVHAWRAEEDAVLVGAATVVHDNTQLTVREWRGRNPVRIILDPEGTLRTNLRIFDDQAKTLSYTRTISKSAGNLEWVKIEGQPENHRIYLPEELPTILSDLHRRGIRSVMVEGGAKTLELFLCAGLWDEARIFRSGQKLNEGITAPFLKAEPEQVSNIDNDTLSVYRNRSAN